jgi:hypothetical protein
MFRSHYSVDLFKEFMYFGTLYRMSFAENFLIGSKTSDLPFMGSILPTSSSDPIQLPGNLSYLHFSRLSSTTMDALFNTLSSLLSGTDPSLLASLERADVIDFDIISSNTIQIRAIWASSPLSEGWQLDISSDPNTRIEVGIFSEATGEDKDEYALGGVRTILAENSDFEPTLFTFPHRHHIVSTAQLNTSLSPSYGSHPTLRTSLSRKLLQPPVNDTLSHETCNLHALYTLSKDVFVDKYQLTQLSQFQSGGIKNLRGVWGETDLEDPSYKTKGWGSIVLVDIDQINSELTLELPLHLRYLEPLADGGYRHLNILRPEIFWACENTVEGIPHSQQTNPDFTISPFSPPARSVLHSLFPIDTVFYHLPNHITQENGVVSIDVPVANASQAQVVQNLTVLGILMGFTYLFVKGVRVGIKGLRWRVKGKEKAKDL